MSFFSSLIGNTGLSTNYGFNPLAGDLNPANILSAALNPSTYNGAGQNLSTTQFSNTFLGGSSGGGGNPLAMFADELRRAANMESIYDMNLGGLGTNFNQAGFGASSFSTTNTSLGTSSGSSVNTSVNTSFNTSLAAAALTALFQASQQAAPKAAEPKPDPQPQAQSPSDNGLDAETLTNLMALYNALKSDDASTETTAVAALSGNNDSVLGTATTRQQNTETLSSTTSTAGNSNRSSADSDMLLPMLMMVYSTVMDDGSSRTDRRQVSASADQASQAVAGRATASPERNTLADIDLPPRSTNGNSNSNSNNGNNSNNSVQTAGAVSENPPRISVGATNTNNTVQTAGAVSENPPRISVGAADTNQTTNTEPVLQTAHQDPVTAPPLQAVDPNDPNVAYHVRVTDYAYRDDNNVERHQLNYYFSTDGGHGFSSGSSKKSVYADMADYHLQRGNLEAASFFHDLAALNLDQNGDGQVDFQEVTSQLGTTITNETIAAFQAGQALPTTGVRPSITRSTSFDRAQASATETQEHVYALFEGLLGREPEADQSNYWISQINAGQLSLDEVAARLLQSAGFATYGDQTLRTAMGLYGVPENVNYTGFATELYHAFLGRAPENDAVVATWANQIREKEQALIQEQRDQGVTYPDTVKARALAFGQAVANFIRSNEFQALMG